MVHRIDVADAQAWIEPTKLAITELDEELCTQVEDQVLAQLATVFDVSTWSDTDTTPKLVKSIIAMYYVSWLYDRQYSEDLPNGNAWAVRLAQMADRLMMSIISGSVQLIDAPTQMNELGRPAFYPDDDSSAMCPTNDDLSLGPARFSMGQVF